MCISAPVVGEAALLGDPKAAVVTEPSNSAIAGRQCAEICWRKFQ